MEQRENRFFSTLKDNFISMYYYIPFVLKEGVRLVNPRGCAEFIKTRMYEKHKDFLPNREGLVLDIGPQYCDYALIAAKKYGSYVLAFEASKFNYAIGLTNILINNADNKVFLSNCAIGDKNDSIKLHYSGGMANAFGLGEEELVSMRKLDELLDELSGTPILDSIKPDLIKLDIEGFEYEALQGMSQTIDKYHPRIIIETHTSLLYEKCSHYLESYGYHLKHEQNKRNDNGPFDLVSESFWS